MGREYSHWIDLTLSSHMEAVISKIYLTKVPLLSNSMFLRSKTSSKKLQKDPTTQKPMFWDPLIFHPCAYWENPTCLDP